MLNTGGRPIRGLFASGDIMGLFFHNYSVVQRPDAQFSLRHDRRQKLRRRRAGFVTAPLHFERINEAKRLKVLNLF